MEGDKNPTWKDKLIFERDPKEDTFYVFCWNFNESGNNDFIGGAYISITPVLPKGVKHKKTAELMFEGHVVGNVSVDYEFSSDNPSAYEEPKLAKKESVP